MKRDIDEIRETIYDALDRHLYERAASAIDALLPLARVEALGLRVSLFIEAGDEASAETALVALMAVRQDMTADEAQYATFLSARVHFMRGERMSVIRDLEPLMSARGGHVKGELREKIANLLGQCYRFIGESEKATAMYLEAAKAARANGDVALAAVEMSDYLFNLHYLPVKRVTDERKKAARYGKLFKDCVTLLSRWRENREHRGKIRVGYISPDIRNHVVLRFSLAFFEFYDRNRFEVIVYMNGAEDEWSAKVRARVDGWRNIRAMSSAEAARAIYEDNIDILVDLAGHTRGNALPVLAFKPAPIQLSGIGYFTSTGLSTVDYFLGDKYLDAPRDGIDPQDGFTDKLLVLPHTHFCYTPMGATHIAPSIEAPCEKNGYVTFASFNNFTKVNDAVLGAWREIMARVDGSRLILKAAVFDYDDTRAYTMERLERAGLDMDRIELRGLTRDYLAEYRDVDIALDTFPYPGGGTTCDALYMGVPVVTLSGATHGSRFGESLMMNIGLGELVTHSVDEYVERASLMARDTELLALLHRSLRGLMERSPLMDARGYMRDVESAYGEIYGRYVASQKVPSYSEAKRYAKLAEKFERDGDVAQSLAASDYVLASRPQNRPLVESLAVRYLDAGDVRGAGAAVSLLMDGAGNDDGFDLFLAASYAFLMNDRDTAEKLAMAALDDKRLEEWQRGATHHLLAEIHKKNGDRNLAAREYLASSRLKGLDNGRIADYDNYLLSLHFDERPRAELLEAARGYERIFDGLAIKPYDSYSGRARHHGKIRVGYISPDFCRHVVAEFSQAFFSAYDHERFEAYGYANCDADDVTQSLAERADAWRMVKGMTYSDIARLIHDDEIDIIVELAGHTGGNSLPMLLMRPAPVSICGVGYFDTTGLSAVDYFLVDETTAPRDASEDDFFTEKLLRLAHIHLCYTPLRPVPDALCSAPAPFTRNGFVTFGSLNQLDKVTDTMIDAWSRILAQTDNARLYLKAGALDDEARRASLMERLAAHGIDTRHVKLEGYSDDYMAAYRDIDIALDTYPYTGGGTTCDALYMGVPVVTLTGCGHHERFGESILKNVGHGELVARSLDEYVATATNLAANKNRLAKLHETIRGEMQESYLMNQRKYMIEVEAAYEKLFGTI